jgi:MFS family permease
MNDAGKFVSGFGLGAGEFGVGLMIFLGDLVMQALKPIATSPQSASVLSTYATAIAMFTIGGVIINLAVGYFSPMIFSLGWLTSDFFMIALLFGPLMPIAPSVISGMVIALIAVLIGILLKVFLKDRGNHYRQYDNWG